MGMIYMKKMLRYSLIMLGLSLICILGIYEKPAHAATVRYGTVTAETLNVRSGPGTNYAIITSGGKYVKLTQGTKMTVNEVLSGWYKVSFTYSGKSLSGYVSGQYVTVTLKEVKVYKPISVAATMRAKYKTGKITLKKNSKVTVIAEKTVKKTKQYRIKFTYKKKTYRDIVIIFFSLYRFLVIFHAIKVKTNIPITTPR